MKLTTAVRIRHAKFSSNIIKPCSESSDSKKTSVMVSGTTTKKSKTVSNEKKSSNVDGSCCGRGKTPPKKS